MTRSQNVQNKGIPLPHGLQLIFILWNLCCDVSLDDIPFTTCCMAMSLKKLCPPPETFIILPKNSGRAEFFSVPFYAEEMKVYDVIMPHGCGKLVAARIQVPLTDLNV